MATGGGGQNLGGAQFTVTANTQQFQQGLQQAQAQAIQFNNTVGVAMQGVTTSVQRGGYKAGYGLLTLGYAVDDLQYGFSAIVNNIPQVVHAFGGSAGLAGGVAIAAVGVNVLLNHWEELQGTLRDTSAFQIAVGAMESLKAAGFDPARGWADLKARVLGGEWDNNAAVAKQRAERGKEADAARKAIGQIGDENQNERAKSFRAALEAVGGGDALLKQMNGQTAQNFRGLDEDAMKQLLDRNAIQIAEGLKGNFGPGGGTEQFGKAFNDKWKLQADAAERKAWLAETNKIDNELRQKRIEKLQDQRDDLQDQKSQLSRHRRSGFSGEFIDYLKDTQARANEQIPRQQLGKLGDIERQLKAIDQSIKKERRARVGP